MNWIKVTPETILPSGVPVLFKTIPFGKILEGTTIPETQGVIELKDSETVYIKGEYSHYCVITEPTDNNLVDRIELLLEASQEEHDPYDSTEGYTRGNIDAYRKCIDILKGND